MHGGHIGIHFEKTNLTKTFMKSERYCRKSCIKVWEFNFYQRRFFCMSAILAAILKNKFDEDVHEVGQIL